MTVASKPMWAVRPLFINFMSREGYDPKNSAYEFDNVLTSNGVPVLRDWYLRVSRVGAPMAISRMDRVFIYETFCNAQNHAAFAAECNQLQKEAA